MDILDGIPVTIKWKKPFIEWANSLGDADSALSTDDNDGTVYLMPDDGDEPEKLLKEFYGVIFEEELAAWDKDEESWPDDRSFTTFKQWFSFEFPEMVVDLSDQNSDEDSDDEFDVNVEPGPPETPHAYAQDLIYQAWETSGSKKRIELARKALDVFPDCTDAYNLLAEEEAKTDEEVLAYYQKAVEAGERALGPNTFKEVPGRFWGVLETRPYMRAKAGLAQSLWKMGRYDEAIRHYLEMLKLNPNDNQGIRYVLLACWGELGRFDEIAEFMENGAYPDEGASEWYYMKALVSFSKEGPSPTAIQQLRTALKQNSYAPEYLLGNKRIPVTLPDSISWRGEDEGMSIADAFLPAWKNVPGALEWLRKECLITLPKSTGRNDLCPCGSGKKFKKCCLNKE